MKSKNTILYSLIFLGGKSPMDDLSDCLTVSCTNMKALEKLSGIKWDRLVYVFTKCKKNVLVESDHIIMKSNQLYKGMQDGRVQVGSYSGFNRNR